MIKLGSRFVFEPTSGVKLDITVHGLDHKEDRIVITAATVHNVTYSENIRLNSLPNGWELDKGVFL